MDIKRSTPRSCNFNGVKAWFSGHVAIIPRDERLKEPIGYALVIGVPFAVVIFHAITSGVVA